MRYRKTVTLKDGRELLIQNAEAADAAELLEVFRRTHGETEFLLTYPDESKNDVAKETAFIESKIASEREVELVAIVDDEIVGSAGVSELGRKDKILHRADFGISILQEYWGLGIGRALTQACIDCAKNAGYLQLELQVVSENGHAIALYRSVGFEEYGRNPKGFLTRSGHFQKIVEMRMEL